MRHVCIVVDNPLRDLDGAVLLARRLTEAGYKATLVPMYDQGFVIPALKPDMVVLNYFRKNNIELVRLYKKLGILVAVVDTEGFTTTPERYANSIHSTGHLDLIDLYCVWGKSQFDAVAAVGEIPREKLFLTGCQRNDFAALPWRRALRSYKTPGYILVNTNFPIANPKFSSGSEAEVKAVLAINPDRAAAERFVAESRRACEDLRGVILRLAQDFPGEVFVVRPHPFESLDIYEPLAELPNVEVLQEGTSFEWLAHAQLLLHLNCMTSIEAAMLGVPAFSLEWLNSDVLRLKTAGEVSVSVASYDELFRLMLAHLSGKESPALLQKQQQLIIDSFHEIDGKASDRICDAISRCFAFPAALTHPSSSSLKRGVRAKAVHLMRRLFGLSAAVRLGTALWGDVYSAKRETKMLRIEVVQNIVDRLDGAAPLTQKLVARPALGVRAADRRLGGATAISIGYE